MKEGFRVSLEIPVRIRDIDAMGHVSNVVYLSYFEEARLAYWNRLALEGRPTIIVSRAEVRYKRPIQEGTTITAKVRCVKMERSRFVLEYRLENSDGSAVFAEGFTEQAFFDYASGKPERIAPAVRERVHAIDDV